MKVCDACGEENPDKAKFCLECATALTAPALRHEERKVVTVLFADLVGFTSRSEAMDVEDVRGTLVPYHQLLRRELERHGGTVEKFIGDAVMALFGAPVAYEDAPERAVRAALAIQSAVARLREGEERLDLHVRIGVNTGEALIALDADPKAGEGMASGDVVNTAARLEAAAPVDGVLVGEVTYRSTSRAVDYEQAEPIQVKGKAAPLRVWMAKAARARLGSDVQQAPATPLVGRRQEAELLWAAFERARGEQSPQLVTLIGVPGIGKSRLVWELLQRVDAERDLTTWRQGRSLPYGEGVAFWALGEMVRAEAGVLESDPAEVTGEKLRRAVDELVAGERDARWVEAHLRTLLGLEGGLRLSGDRRGEAFAAWRRFVEGLAERRPTVLVFEDLHWADDALLDFVDHLVEWASDVPLLVLCTSRPELLERRAGWGGGKANAILISLSSLSATDTARLVAALLQQAALPVQAQSGLLGRAEGNPLYAEEYVRMLIDRGVLVRDGAHWRLREGDVPLPESVQAIIAARLDALSAEEKGLLQAASVMGKVVWLGALEAIAGVSRWQAEELLHRLERKEFVRRERASSVEGETEYAFRHILVRDVAYGQIPRAERVARHTRAADWIESLAQGRGDRVEMLAHHRRAAFDYASAAGAASPELASRARAALEAAADHAARLSSFAVAASLYAASLELTAAGDAQRPQLLLRLGLARMWSDDVLSEELRESAERLRESGELDDAVRAEVAMQTWLRDHGRVPDAEVHLGRALELTERLPPSPVTVQVMLAAALNDLLAGRHGAARAAAQDALGAHDTSPDNRLRAQAILAAALLFDDDPAGIAELETAVALTQDGRSSASLIWGTNLLDCLIWAGELQRADAMLASLSDSAERLGHALTRIITRVAEVHALYRRGEWQAASKLGDTLLADAAARRGDEIQMESDMRLLHARVHLARGDLASAEQQTAAAVELAHAKGGDPDVLLPALAFESLLLASLEQPRADQAIEELIDRWRGHVFVAASALPDLALACALRRRQRALHDLLGPVRLRTPWLVAAEAAADGRWRDAADVYAGIGALADAARARLEAGRALIEDGNRGEGEEQLAQGLAFWRAVDAAAYVAQSEELLPRAEST